MTIDTASPLSPPLNSSLPSSTPPPDTPLRAPRDVGPDARLVALPQLEDGLPPTVAGLDDHLARIERARHAQLVALPPAPDHVVAVAHRRIVTRYLEQVRDARARLRAGTYGTCADCRASISPRLLTREPWRTTCAECAPDAR